MRCEPAFRVPPENEMSGSPVPVVVRLPPAKIPKGSAVVVRFDPVAENSGPRRLKVPDVAVEPDRFSSPAPLVAFANGSKPPRFTVVLLSWTNGLGLVLDSPALRTRSRLNRAEIVLPSDWRSGPARFTFDGATSSAAGAPVKVSATLTTFPPD